MSTAADDQRAGAGAGRTPRDGPHLGLYLPQVVLTFDQILERALAAEAAGLHSVWFMDHLAAPGRPAADTLEGWTLLAAVAARTERIRLGLLVGCDAFRHPAVLAKSAVTVDAVSGGRLELGLGWGSVPQELEAFGIDAGPPRQRAARLRETLEVLERLFTGEPVTYAGEHVRLAGAVCRPRPVQDHIPIHVGGTGPALTMPLVRDHADWWNCPSYGVDRLAELAPLAGDARISVQHPVGLILPGLDADEVRATAVRRFGTWGGLLVGTPEEVGGALLAEHRAVGAELFVLQLSDFGRPETVGALGGCLPAS